MQNLYTPFIDTAPCIWIDPAIYNSPKFIKQKDHKATYIASSKQQLAINFTVHKNMVKHLDKINFTKFN